MRLVAVLTAIVVLVTSGWWLSRHAEQNAAFAQAGGEPSRTGQAGKFVGASSCAVLGVCHGSPSARTQYNVNQNENYIWLKKDKHAKAYDVLLKNRSLRIAKNLGLPSTAAKSPKCLSCHALNVTAAQREEKFQLEDGVGCEVCHGPAGNWIIEHARTGPEGYTESLQLGMYDIRDLRKRAEKCLSCHLGDDEKSVDHAMIAAGHPMLTFELDTFAARMPPHWRASQDKWPGTRAWAIGQAVALREAAKQLSRRAQQANAPGWPEFAEFDCFACHHAVRNIESTYYTRARDTFLKEGTEWSPSWRQAKGVTGVTGIPSWDASRVAVFRHLVGVVSPQAQPMFDQELTALVKLMGKLSAADPKQLSAQATRVAQLANELLPQLTGMDLNAQLAATLIRNISGAGDAVAGAGFRVAGQAAMALDALWHDYKKHGKPTDTRAIDDAIQRLFEALEKPEEYDAEQFSRHLQAVHRLFLMP